MEKGIEEEGDYGFISKYIKDDNRLKELKNEKKGFPVNNFTNCRSNCTEVFGSIGEGESFSENPFNKRNGNERDSANSKSDEEIENESDVKPDTEAKKEFIKHLQDDSLSLDTCDKINHDWKRN